MPLCATFWGGAEAEAFLKSSRVLVEGLPWTDKTRHLGPPRLVRFLPILLVGCVIPVKVCHLAGAQLQEEAAPV